MHRILCCLFAVIPASCLYAQEAWINELHYDNEGVDTLEFLEVLMPAPADTSGLWLWLYDGVTGLPYDSASAGEWIIGDFTADYRLYTWFPEVMQNGPDGLAISRNDSLLVFVSYEGSFIATGGVASGRVASVMEIEEGSDPGGISAQRTGSGSRPVHFWWSAAEATPGKLNHGQLFTRDPVLLFLPPSCLDFGQVPYGATSLGESLVIAGANLTGILEMNLPAGFEWSHESGFLITNPAGLYSFPLTEDYYPPDTIHIRFTPGPAGGLVYDSVLKLDVDGHTAELCLKGREGPFPEPLVWINEIHYDNISTDENEFVEMVLSTADTSALPHLALHFYNGNNQLVYKFSEGSSWEKGYKDLEGFIYVTASVSGIQNGIADGIALSYRSRLISFLSYEGTLTALDGPAAGYTSEDIGVMEDTDAPLNSSLQLVGTGGSYEDFYWVYFPGEHTRNQPNHDQVLPVVLSDYEVVYTMSGYVIRWTSHEEVSHDHYELEWSADGDEFNTFARISPAGTLPYTYKHPWPAYNDGYVRLVQVDLDGSKTVYEVLRHPQPETLRTEDVELRIYDLNGRYMLGQWVEEWNGILPEEVLRRLPAGGYVVHLHSPEWKKSLILLKDNQIRR